MITKVMMIKGCILCISDLVNFDLMMIIMILMMILIMIQMMTMTKVMTMMMTKVMTMMPSQCQ